MNGKIKKITISLIIPVYNVQDYLERSLNSVEKQTFKDFEAIIVNDGSTDNSLEIIKKFVARNKNFFLINQENKGLSEARNAGIEKSSGNYIAFLDSDDFLEPNYLKVFYSTALKTGADIVCCNFYFYYTKTKLRFPCPLTSIPGVYSGEEAFKKIVLCMGTFMFAWNKFFKRELFFKYKIKFYGINFEDCVTSPCLFFYAQKVAFITDILYNYVMRKTSIVHNMDATKINDFVRAIGANRNFYEKKGIYKKYRRRLKTHSLVTNFIVFYDLFVMHLKCANFNRFFKNVHAATKSLNYFVSDHYQPVNKFLPDLMYPVKNPKD
ncbi:MAG: glycosyltransferase [Oscillospiraceae bacterium]|jgi:glycosyltransferase involved in cell wall biosynthesis|nr:glycosyltransferase [Oscillospiraceae bacterium]